MSRSKDSRSIKRPGREVTVDDKMQQGYCYKLTQPAGEGFDPQFSPDLTPRELLELGVFGGLYMTDCQHEFPEDWYKKARLSPGKRDSSLNFFGVHASTSLAYWRNKGWIHPDDPRGWFQWYCRYYMGRRHEDDGRQIKRWKAMTHHVAQLKNNCYPGDLDCRPRQRQALLHWTYDSRNF